MIIEQLNQLTAISQLLKEVDQKMTLHIKVNIKIRKLRVFFIFLVKVINGYISRLTKVVEQKNHIAY